MFILYADKNCLTVRQSEPVISGSVNVCQVQFEFSEDWEGMTRTAVFKAGGVSASVLLDKTGLCTIPWEVLEVSGRQLIAGVCGRLDGDIVRPTAWVSLGTILEGATAGREAQPPSPDLWEQALAGKQDRLTGLPGQVVGFDYEGRAAAQNINVSRSGFGFEYLVADGLTQYGSCTTTIFGGYQDPVKVHRRLRLDFWLSDIDGYVGLYTSVFLDMAVGEDFVSISRFLPTDEGQYVIVGLNITIDSSARMMYVNIEDVSGYLRKGPIRLTIGYLPAEQMGVQMMLLEVS